jgi:hypothetical protein
MRVPLKCACTHILHNPHVRNPYQSRPSNMKHLNSLFRCGRALALGLVGVGMLASASAMSLRELRTLEKSDKKAGPIYAQYYLVGVMEGIIEADAQAQRAGATPSICLNGRRLAPSMARGLLDAELKRNEGVYEADMTVQLIMSNALLTVYPCL